MFGKGGMGNLMKQAQMMQERMQKMQEEVAKMEVTGESGAGNGYQVFFIWIVKFDGLIVKLYFTQ